ncbi:hypothetical protein LSH36_582g03044 [Paralvinella palmiformis]|uniref:Ion transport domain-containing protein n=1 Tax=Paralvinella palmiformis TaxID=53620 RepID=A0AAD9J662_9ANNE|nr:hypothetical protein LSH36_582g03044 [Paralvinella palmiformis]
MKVKALAYLSDPWNRLDLFTITSFLVGVVLSTLRTYGYCTACDQALTVISSLTLMALYFRLLHIFSMHRDLGPKLVMIGGMRLGLFHDHHARVYNRLRHSHPEDHVPNSASDDRGHRVPTEKIILPDQRRIPARRGDSL